MPALPSSLIAPLWSQIESLLPPMVDDHPLGCHRPRVAARIVFDKLISCLVLGGSYPKHAEHTVSATTLRSRRDEWITAGVFDALEHVVLEAFNWLIGLDLEHLSVDECCVKAPCGGDHTGPNPTDRGTSGQKRSVLVKGQVYLSAPCWPEQTGMTPRGWSRRWHVYRVSGSSCRNRLRCIWMLAMIHRSPGTR